MRRSYWRILLNSVFILLLMSAVAMSAVPPYMNYQGRLTDDTGHPVDTISNITFTLYTDDGLLTELWTETQLSVVVADGLFQVFLGLYNPMTPDLFDGATRLIGIKLGDGPENTPLLPIVSVAYAQKAGHADTAAYALAVPGSNVGGGWVDDGNYIRLETSGDNVGIGIAIPTEKLDVDGNVRIDGTLNIGDRFLFNGATNKITSTSNYINFDTTTIQMLGQVRLGSGFSNRRLQVATEGTHDTIALQASNLTGTAASFASGLSGFSYSAVSAAVNATSDGISHAGRFNALGDGHAVTARANGSGHAIHGDAAGTGYSGFFEGGLGVKVDGDLEATGSFKLPTGAVAGRVLTSDASGVATWQSASSGGSPWTSNGTAAYLNDPSLNVGIGTGVPSSKLVVDGNIWSTGVGAFGGPIFGRKTLAAYASGTGDSFAVWGTNSNGTAAGFFSGTNANVAPGTPAAVYARSGGDSYAGSFNAMGDGIGLNVYSAGSGDALRVYAAGSSYSGRFGGGLGVRVSGDLEVTGAFRLSTGGASGHVLTSDATGVASWQANTGGSPWTLDGSNVYFSDTSFNAAVGTTSPPTGKKLSAQTTGTGANMAFSALNTTGTAAAFFSGGDGTAFPNTPAAVYARSEGNNYAGLFKAAGNGRGITIEADGAGTALHSESFGTGYAGRFKGGLGVRIEGRLVAVTSTGYAGTFSGGQGVLVESDLRVIGTTVGDDAVDLPDNSISSDEILNEPGIAVESNSSAIPLSTTGVDIETVTITIPTNGYVHVTGFCMAQLFNYPLSHSAAFQISDVANGAQQSPYVIVGLGMYGTNGMHRFSVATQNVFYKVAGTHTFYLNGRHVTPNGPESGDANGAHARLVAVFYPTSYGTVKAIVGASDATLFENAELVSSDGTQNSEQLYQVDLRELELKAARARADAEKAERELLEAQMHEQEASMNEGSGR